MVGYGELDLGVFLDQDFECKEELLKDLCFECGGVFFDSEDKIFGRYCCFIGDLGIEVCVCNWGYYDDDFKEFNMFIDDVLDGFLDFCDSCYVWFFVDEEEGFCLFLEGQVWEYGYFYLLWLFVCLLLNIINEQDFLNFQYSGFLSQDMFCLYLGV